MPDEPAVLAIDGGEPLRAAPWPEPPLVEPAGDVDPARRVEEALSAFLGLPEGHVLAYGDAAEAYRAALEAIPRTLERDEVIVPALFAEAAAEAALAAGWRVVPGDVEPDTGALSARGLVRAKSERTAGVVVVHAFGHPASMPDLEHSAGEDLVLVEDITGALGATVLGAPVGLLGQRSVLVGHHGHPLTRGAFVIFGTLEEASAAGLARARDLPDEDARVALAEVRRLGVELRERQQLAWELRMETRRMKGVNVMPHGKRVRHAYAMYLVPLRGTLWKRPIEDTVAAIRAEGVPAALACPAPLHHHEAVRAALPDDPRLEDDALTVASRLPRELITIPIHSNLTSKDMQIAAAVLKKVEGRSI